MKFSRGEINVRLIIFAVASLLFAIFVGRTISRVPPLFPIAIVAGVIVCLITLVRTDFGLIILIFSMLLSPEFSIAQVPERAVVVRVDDVLLLIVFFTWLAKMAVNKQLGLLKPTALNVPIGIYIALCILFTARGAFVGQVNPVGASFYILKFIEYFMLYFMFVNNITSKRQMQVFMVMFFLTCFIITILGCVQIASGVIRPAAPFEGAHSEPNTLAGYLLFVSAVVFGLLIYAPSFTQRILLGGLLCLILFVFTFSLSRSSYVAFFPMYLCLILVTKKKKMLLSGILLLTVVLMPILTPDIVKQRIKRTLILMEKYQELGGVERYELFEKYHQKGMPMAGMERHRILGQPMVVEASAAARIYHWQYAWRKWRESPLFGHGIIGIDFIDAQYMRILAELGTIGFLIFVWILVIIFKTTLRTFQASQDRLTQGLCLGFLAGYVGLLFQALAVNTFIIVRIMEPFWFLTAIIMRLSDFQSG